MTYTYKCTNCGEIVEINCSIAEKDEREKSLVCPSCNGNSFRRIFNAFVARLNGAGSSASKCATCKATSCSSCR